MKLNLRTCLMTLIISFVLSNALAQQYGNIIYTIPANWKQADQKGLRFLVPDDISTGKELAIVLTNGADLNGDFKTSLESLVSSALSNTEKLVQQTPVQDIGGNNNGYQVLSKTIVVDDNSGNRTYRTYTAANTDNKRIELFVIITNDLQMLKNHEKDINDFFKSVSFANLSTKDNNVTAQSNTKNSNSQSNINATTGKTSAIVALYVSNVLVNRPKSFGIGYEYRTYNEYWLLLKDGRVIFSFPKSDPSKFDYNKFCEENPKLCAHYQLANGKYSFRYANKDISFSSNETVINAAPVYSGQVGKTVFRKVEPENNLRFNGSFSHQTFTDLSSNISTGNVSGQTTFTFSADGTFIIEGYTGFTATSKGTPMQSPQEPGAIAAPDATGNTSVTGSSRDRQTGTYRISNNQLELTYRNGYKESFYFFRWPGEENAVICINGVNYLHR